MGYDRGDSFPFDFEPNVIPFGSKLIGLANASIDKLSKCIFFPSIFFSLGLWKGYLKFEYKSGQEGEKTHILVKTAGL